MGKSKKQKTNQQTTQQQQQEQSFDQSGYGSEWGNALNSLFSTSSEKGGFDSTSFLNALQQMTQQQQQQQSATGSATSSSAFSRDDAQSMQQRQAQEIAQREAQEMAQRQAEEFARREAQETAQTQQTGVDAESQAYVNEMRRRALNSLNGVDPNSIAPSTALINQTTSELANPHAARVIDGVGQTYDRLRDKSRMETKQGATLAGAYGGSRQGVAEGVRAAELDRAEADQTGRILSDSYESARGAAMPVAAARAMSPFQFASAQADLLSRSLGPTGTIAAGRGTQTGSTAGSQMGSTSGSTVGSTSGSTVGSTSGSTVGSSAGRESTSTIQQQISNLLGLLSGSTSSAQTGGQSGTQWGQNTGLSSGLLSTSGGSNFDQSGRGSSSMNSSSNSTMTQSTRNPWYQDVLGAASIFGGLGGFGGLGKIFGGGSGVLASRIPSSVGMIPSVIPSPTDTLRVRPRKGGF